MDIDTLKRRIQDHCTDGLVAVVGSGLSVAEGIPGSPWQNGYIESFNARLREECLNREQLLTLTEARVVLEDWRWKYNHVRPHRSLGYITPLEFAQQEDVHAGSDSSSASSRPPASLRHSLNLLYHLEQLIHPAKLTQAMGQFG